MGTIDPTEQTTLCATEAYPGAEEMPEAYPDDRTVPILATNVTLDGVPFTS